jgi:hypothetical protein
MTTNARIAIIFVLIIAVIVFFAISQRTAPVTSEISYPKIVATTTLPVADNFTYINATPDLISVTSPTPKALLDKEFTISGSARGTWYFEATFPVIVKDLNGNVIAQVPAKANGDWMTTNFVPFTVTIKIPATYSGPATIVLKKDNPSGLVQNDSSVSFPVTIK